MGYINTILILGGINVIAALGVSILTGYTGLFSIGHAGFMALGGYLSAILIKEYEVHFALALIIGGLFAGVASLIIGYPSFRSRLRGDYFAIATLGFSEAIRLLLNNMKQLGSLNIAAAHGIHQFLLGISIPFELCGLANEDGLDDAPVPSFDGVTV